MRSTPFDEIERAFERMTRQFDELGRQWDGESLGTGVGAGMSVDVAEYDDEVVLMADLPGYEKDEIDVSATDHTLTIRAEHDERTESGEEGHYLRRERRSRSVRRSLRLPEGVDGEGASAAYKNGVLTVTLPKATAGEPDEDGRHIDVE